MLHEIEAANLVHAMRMRVEAAGPSMLRIHAFNWLVDLHYSVQLKMGATQGPRPWPLPPLDAHQQSTKLPFDVPLLDSS